MTNPFEQHAAQQSAQQAQQPAAGNPFAQPAAQQPAYAPQQQPAQVPAGNPFGAGVPAQPAPQGNPYAQPVAPQAYQPPAQQPAYAPQQQAPAAYAPPAQQQAPAQIPSGPPPALNVGDLRGAGAPPPVGDGRGAKMADMYGRLVLVFPLAIARRPRNPQYITAEQRARGDLEQDQLTATVVVLDDGNGGMQPIAFGGAPYELPPRPHTESSPLPYVRKAMWITQSRVIGQLRDSLPQPGGAPGMVIGRVVKAGPQRNDPWFLQGATEADLRLGGQYLELVQQGVYPHPLA
jgi:hypothetical protein